MFSEPLLRQIEMDNQKKHFDEYYRVKGQKDKKTALFCLSALAIGFLIAAIIAFS